MSTPGLTERLLTDVALAFDALVDLTFAIEWQMFGPRTCGISAEAPVFIIGHARAGTTILTRAVHATSKFASLTYADMPFPLAPNGWHAVIGRHRRPVAAHERSHGDGLLHDLDSPEALEELFWRVWEGENYIRKDRLLAHRPQSETMRDFVRLMRLTMLRYGRQRYLSKNNNNILRIGTLAKHLPDALFLVPYRHPFEHAASLLAQHRHSLGAYQSHPFQRRYIRYLAHHEFGSDHRPFDFEMVFDGRNTDDPNYWLSLWIATYQHALRKAPSDRTLFVRFEDLCNSPFALLEKIGEFIGVSTLSKSAPMLQLPQTHEPLYFIKDLADKAQRLYDELRSN